MDEDHANLNALTTQRWSPKLDETPSALWDFGFDDDGQFALAEPNDQIDSDLPDSPWTIEAVDGEADSPDDPNVS